MATMAVVERCVVGASQGSGTGATAEQIKIVRETKSQCLGPVLCWGVLYQPVLYQGGAFGNVLHANVHGQWPMRPASDVGLRVANA